MMNFNSGFLGMGDVIKRTKEKGAMGMAEAFMSAFRGQDSPMGKILDQKPADLPKFELPRHVGKTDFSRSVVSQSLGNTQANQLAQPKIDLPRWAGKQRVGPSVIRQSLDNVKNNKKEKRNVASDDWFHINSKPNNKDFF